MARLLRVIMIILLLGLPLAASLSRDDRLAQGVPQAEQTVIPFVTQTPFIPVEGTPEPPTPTPFITATPLPSVDVSLLLNARNDLELLADTVLGVGVRPEGWSGPASQHDPQIGLLTRLDLELLATTLINPSDRPTEWFGAVGSTPYAIARDVRHDLEVLATFYGFRRSQRPGGWIGADPLLTCNRSTQTLINLLQRGTGFRLSADANDPDFCRNAEIEVTRFTEVELLANAQIGELFSQDVALLSPHSIISGVAVAFLDSAAQLRVGVVPQNLPIRPIARSTVDFSRMMLIAGDGFQVFVDHQDTTLSAEQYRQLPNLDALEYTTYCNAQWCSGG